MKTNKKITYLLAAFLVIIWGAIAYQIISALYQNDDEDTNIASTLSDTKDYKKSGYVYVDDVRDPFKFGYTIKKDTVHKNKKLNVALVWVPPPFRLTGILIDKQKKTVILEGNDGSVYFLQECDTLGGVKILGITEKEVKYYWQRQKGKWELQ